MVQKSVTLPWSIIAKLIPLKQQLILLKLNAKINSENDIGLWQMHKQMWCKNNYLLTIWNYIEINEFKSL